MWVKICGVTTQADAKMVAESGADAIGLNFYPPSKRFVPVETAAMLRQTVGDGLEVVGVFVNLSADEVAKTAHAVDLRAVQFHGDESVDTLVQFHKLQPSIEIIRAFRVGPDGADAMTESVKQITNAGVPLKAVLVDAYVPGEYGGTGHRVQADWLMERQNELPPLILAGGLTPENVADAAAEFRPWGVDTASGVESAPGVKAAGKVTRFVTEIRCVENNRT